MDGHAGAGDAGHDIVCAAVSSAAYLVANTVSDVMHVSCKAEAAEGHFLFELAESDARYCQDLLNGLNLHVRQLQQQYPQNIKVLISEV